LSTWNGFPLFHEPNIEHKINVVYTLD
jgi:hypothetical protein